jgi:hypothetical protein
MGRRVNVCGTYMECLRVWGDVNAELGGWANPGHPRPAVCAFGCIVDLISLSKSLFYRCVNTRKNKSQPGLLGTCRVASSRLARGHSVPRYPISDSLEASCDWIYHSSRSIIPSRLLIPDGNVIRIRIVGPLNTLQLAPCYERMRLPFTS